MRRAFLCGTDQQSGFNFDHRKQWIEDRILLLGKIFAIDIFGYAVMSNHYHIVLQVDSSEASSWSDSDIVDKWLILNPRRSDNKEALVARKLALLGDLDRLAILRERLCSLSWFMRYLNEPLARFANKEDDCKGRFWESRFKSQRLLDDNAVLACMIYVDLNPVRAGIVDDIVKAKNTSLVKRLNIGQGSDEPMSSIEKPGVALPFTFTLDRYIQLARWTVTAQQTSRSTSFSGIPSSELWVHHYLPKPGHWQRALGSVQSIKDYAKDIGQRWIRTRFVQFAS
ncbi:MAG: transposase [Gammaproteobacteria bacterium]|nr:transposase [Gammaproteobacteria bacterium]